MGVARRETTGSEGERVSEMDSSCGIVAIGVRFCGKRLGARIILLDGERGPPGIEVGPRESFVWGGEIGRRDESNLLAVV
jgi:hypothetical protein